MIVSRRKLLTIAAAGAVLPRAALAEKAREITWDDLIPPGVPYSEIIGEGEMDERNDIWRPIFDSNATKLNPALDGAYIKMPGFIIPIDLTSAGVNSFVLVPYTGACIHTPPPPPNQLVFVTTITPWPSDNLWDAVWVTGRMQHDLQTTEVAQTGYVLEAAFMEVYVW
ncbi:DUF3299 domain-containing protein [Celeribacter marinus]|uniref:DUF3299 domain-containing protein n=1 Tax=Celeribacter marinus TaxID=1397108 RepID=UPI003F6A60FF